MKKKNEAIKLLAKRYRMNPKDVERILPVVVYLAEEISLREKRRWNKMKMKKKKKGKKGC